MDTGADLNFISSRIAKEMIRKGVGSRGKGKYRIMDAFKKTRLFFEHLSFNFTLDDLQGDKELEVFSIKAVIIDIPLLSDVII